MVRYFLILLFCTGCQSAMRDASGVSALVESRIEKSVAWNQDSCDVRCWLEADLTRDRAVEIALLNSPKIQATLEEIGIAQADLIQAGLLQNPLFEGFVRFPDRHSLRVNTEFSIAQNFLDLLLIPLRKKVAEADFEKTQAEVAHLVLELNFEVQETFYRLQAEQTQQRLLVLWVEAAEAASQLAKGQTEQGNISALEANRRRASYLEKKVALAQNEKAIIRLREQMNGLLGLSSDPGWRLEGDLPDLPKEELSLESLEEVAIAQRLDLEALRWEMVSLDRMFATKEGWAYTALSLGVSTEKEAEGGHVTGPTFSAALPLFNHGQADRTRLAALYRQTLDRLKMMEIEVRAQVRVARAQLMVNRRLTETYLQELLPLQEQIVNQSQQFYNGMAIGVYELLEAKQQELQLQIAGEMALRDYWLTRVELDRAIGGGSRCK
jgi:outer membrane protein, heavy metal efflux system